MSSTAAALTQLIIDERASLVRRVERIVGNRADAEEVAQALWLKVQRIGDHPPILRKRAFLYRLASNLAIDMQRSAVRRCEIEDEVQALLSEWDDSPGADRIVDSLLTLGRVKAAAQQLPEPTKSIFRLNRFEGLSQKAIAERMGLSTTSIENHIRRALDILACARDEGAAGQRDQR
jgi:RNA polymerase sigma-70 factor (ECF subfamily)